MNITNAFLKLSLQVTYPQSQNFFLKIVRQMLLLGVEHKSTDSNPAVQWLTTSGQIQYTQIQVAHTLLTPSGPVPTF